VIVLINGQVVESLSRRAWQIHAVTFFTVGPAVCATAVMANPRIKVDVKHKRTLRISHLVSARIYFTATWLNAAFIPFATDSVFPTDQKCIKNSRGCSVSM